MGQRGRGRGLAGTVATQRLRGVAEEVGGGAHDRLDRPAKEDEQRLRKVVCERRSVGVRWDDPPHDEAPRPHLRPFQTVSEGLFSEVQVRPNGVLRSSHGPGPMLIGVLMSEAGEFRFPSYNTSDRY